MHCIHLNYALSIPASTPSSATLDFRGDDKHTHLLVFRVFRADDVYPSFPAHHQLFLSLYRLLTTTDAGEDVPPNERAILTHFLDGGADLHTPYLSP